MPDVAWERPLRTCLPTSRGACWFIARPRCAVFGTAMRAQTARDAGRRVSAAGSGTAGLGCRPLLEAHIPRVFAPWPVSGWNTRPSFFESPAKRQGALRSAFALRTTPRPAGFIYFFLVGLCACAIPAHSPLISAPRVVSHIQPVIVHVQPPSH